MTDDLSTYLSSAKPDRAVRCLTCTGDPDLAAHIERFVKLVQARKTAISLRQFHAEFLVPRGYELTYPGMLNHVRRCLKRDVE